MTINEAIQKAVKGGYDGERSTITLASTFDTEGKDFFAHSIHKALLDPEFWKALGKARGWYKYSEVEIELPTNEESRKQRLIELENNFGVILRIHDHLAIVSPYKKEQKTWREYAHDWFSNRLSGGSDDDWFEKNL